MIRNLINVIWDRWANWHPFVRFLLGAGMVAVVGVFAVKPAYRAFKAWRLEKNLVAARVAVDAERMNEARDLSLTVLRAGDPRIEAFRILEEATASLRDPRHGDIARALISHPDGSEEDRWTGFRGIAPEAPLGLVGQAWAALPEERRREPRFAVVFAERLISERRLNEAASVLLEVPENDRAGAVERQLIRVLIRSGKKQAFDEAQRLIARGFRTGEAAEWLDLLEEIPAVSLQPKVLEPVREALETPEHAAAPRAALMLARFDYAANGPRRAAVLEEAVARWKESDPEALANFLGDLGLHRMLLESIPVERAAEFPSLFPRLWEAIADAGAWERAGFLVEVADGKFAGFEALARRAVVAEKSGKSSEFKAAWTAAMDEAKVSKDTSAYLKLHRIAREAELAEPAELAMIEAIRQGRGPLPLYSDLGPMLASLAAQGRENILMEICSIYLAFEPGSPVLLTRYAYLACLSDLADPTLIVKAMEPLAGAFPKEMPILCVLATAYLCAGEPEKAAATLEPLELDPAKLAPPYRITWLASRVLNGKLPKDDPRVADFPWKSLQPSERRKFTALIGSHGS